ncbi:hypothetical protein [Demequina pelophila]|uniref:hypothetical protein n=1 Tax=Demequina pelophila TaxID=1638984 RepID=UPI00078262C6|nr:hypothetical protein [Demequina pelophila]
MTDESIPEIPDTPEELMGPRIAALLTPMPRPGFVTALCALNKISGRVLETSAGSLLVLDDASPEASEAAAKACSGFASKVHFLLVRNEAGQLTADLWAGGSQQRSLPPGLALADAPGVVTSILTGAQTIDDVAETHPEKVHGTNMGRIAAFRLLARETRALRGDAAAAKEREEES